MKIIKVVLYNTLTPSTPSRAAIAQDTGIYSLWYSEMNDIKKRMGELRFGGGQDGDFWARTYGSEYLSRSFGL